MILVNYFIYVQFYGIILAIIKAILLFKDNYSYQLSLLGVLDVLCIGRIYKERILAEQLVVNVDYAYRVSTYLFGLFKVQKYSTETMPSRPIGSLLVEERARMT
jgi:hypothetical protein